MPVENKGFSVVEVLTAVAVLGILVSVILGVGRRVRTQAEIRLCESTLGVLVSAMEQFEAFDYKFRDADTTTNPDVYAGYGFPPDCLIYPPNRKWNSIEDGYFDLEDVLADTLGHVPADVVVPANGGMYRSCRLLYFFLDRAPTSRAVLSAISGKFVTAEDVPGTVMKATILGNVYPLFRVVDPWGTTLRYWYDGGEDFPVVESAGPDRDFGDVRDTDPPTGAERDNIKSSEI